MTARGHPRVAFIDIENSPILGYAWEYREADLLWIVKDWYILSFSVQWKGGKRETWALPDFPLYRKDRENDRDLVKKLWEVFNEAEILVAHNGDRFDVLKANARFIQHKLPPPAPFQTVDTLKEARKVAKFTSNKLDDVCAVLGIGRKIPHTGKNLWRACMEGDLKAWKVMKRYNEHDVVLLVGLYNYLLPWMKAHPNLSVYSGTFACPKCGSFKVQRRGKRYNKTKEYQQYACLSCRAWSYAIIKRDSIELR